MPKPPTKATAARPVVQLQPGKLSPWLESVRDATGIDPRTQQAAVTILLLDRSGSMSESIADALDGARTFNGDALSAGQSVGLIVFSTEATLVSKPSRTGIAAHLKSVACDGSTNMAAAITLAMSCLERGARKRTIVLATDGQPDDRQATLAAAEAAKRVGIRVITIGTKDADANFLRQIASSTEMSMSARSGELGKAIVHAARLLLK